MENNRPLSTSTHTSQHSTTESQNAAQPTTQTKLVVEQPPPHHNWTAYSGPVLFTGPSGLRNYVANTNTDFQMVGNGDRSREDTSEMSYLNRPPPGAKFPKAKNGQIGEIGWPVEHFKIVKGI